MNRLSQDFRQGLNYGWIILGMSTCLAFLVWTAHLTNQFGIFSIQKLALGMIFIPAFFVALTWACGRFFVPRPAALSRKGFCSILFLAILITTGISALFPPPIPALTENHTLSIVVLNGHNRLSQGSGVEIQQLRFLDGSPVPASSIKLSGDWQVINETLFSKGTPSTTLEYSGAAPAGILIIFKYNLDAGMVRVTWDNQPTDYDLYSPTPSLSKVVLNGFSFQYLPLLPALAYLFSILFYAAGLCTCLLIVSLAIRLGWIKPTWYGLLVLSVLVFAVFLKLKLTYPTFIAERTFRDTTSYLNVASQPLNSLGFWAGERTFTFPLLVKLLGISSQNLAMANVFMVQAWFSVFCWTCLALAVAFTLRQRWLKPFGFGIILFFSLNLEISLWDSLLLTESLSFSLLALLLAVWIFRLAYPGSFSALADGAYLTSVCLISFLYAFTRDTNMYFVLICAAVFAGALIFKRVSKTLKTTTWIYSVAMLALLIFSMWSLNVSNRWRVFIYDQLALRILPDPAATAYFAKAGLPISDKLMNITGMVGYQYQNMLENDLTLQPVRDWIMRDGKQVYIQYLLSRPFETLSAPLIQIGPLINSSNQQNYIYPRFLPLSIPGAFLDLTSLFYPHSTWVLLLLLIGTLAGSVLFWLRKYQLPAIWLVLSAILISTYPLMFLVWHGEPIEIERHAAQIGIQFRLAGWMAVLLLVDLVATSRWFRGWLDLLDSVHENPRQAQP